MAIGPNDKFLGDVTIKEATTDLATFKNIVTSTVSGTNENILANFNLGLFSFKPSSTSTPNDLNVILPNDINVSNPGRWELLNFQQQTFLKSSNPTINDDQTKGYRNGDIWLNIITNFSFICKDNTFENSVWIELKGELSFPKVNNFTATLGQTTFVLSETPSYPSSGILTLNGQERIYGVDYTISGINLTWNDSPSLLVGDILNYYYSYSVSSPPGGAVSSVFTRNGDVVAAINDYSASQIDNNSSVSGSQVDNALDTLNNTKEPTLTKGDISGEANRVNITGGTNSIIGSGVNITLPDNLVNKSYPCIVDYDGRYQSYPVDIIAGTGADQLSIYVPIDARSITSIKARFFVSSGAAGSGKDIDITTYYCEVGEPYNQYSQNDTTSTYDFTGYDDKLFELDITNLFTDIVAGMSGTINWDNNNIGGNLYMRKIIVNYIV